ncbi:MAG: DUF3857 domain-containing protein [Prevotella sp.]|nr:DUF3857 domain-containing protein [Candidatus Equicola stercoris]
MKRLISLLFAVSLCNLAYCDLEKPNTNWGKPTMEEMEFSGVSNEPDANAIVLYAERKVEYESSKNFFDVIYEIKKRVKILKSDGKNEANISIDYHSSSSSKELIYKLKASSFNMVNGKMVETKTKGSDVVTEQITDTWMRKKFTIPKVQEGSIIEYQYTIKSENCYSIRMWYAQEDIPVLYSKYDISIPEYFEFNLAAYGMEPMEHQHSTENRVYNFYERGTVYNYRTIDNRDVFVCKNLPSLKEDPYIWNLNDFRNGVSAELRSIMLPGSIKTNYSNTWEKVDEMLLKEDGFGGQLKNSIPLKDEMVAMGIDTISDKIRKITAAYSLLKSKIKWNGDYSLWSESSNKALKVGSGSNADINFLFINMMNGLRINAYPVVMAKRSDKMLPYTHASIKDLTTMIVAIETEPNKYVYIDGSVEYGYIDVLPEVLLVNRARIINTKDGDKWVNLQKLTKNRDKNIIMANLSEDGHIVGTWSRMLTGNIAALKKRQFKMAKDSMEYINNKAVDAEITITNAKLTGHTNFSPTMTEEISFTAEANASDDMIYVNPMIIPDSKTSPFIKEERKLPVEFPFTWNNIYNVQLTIPDNYSVEETPQALTVSTPDKNITCQIITTVIDNKIITSYRFNLDSLLYTAAEYPQLKQIFDMVTEKMNSTIVLKKK